MVSTIPLVLLESLKYENELFTVNEKPRLLPYILTGAPLLLAGILWLIVDVSFLFKISNVTSENVLKFFISFITIHLMPFYLGILNILRLIIIYKNTHYLLSDTRMIMCHGLYRKKIDVVKFSDIDGLKLKKSVFDRMFSAGTITIYLNPKEDSDEEFIEIISLEKYLKVYKHIKKSILKQRKEENKIENIIERKSVS